MLTLSKLPRNIPASVHALPTRVQIVSYFREQPDGYTISVVFGTKKLVPLDSPPTTSSPDSTNIAALPNKEGL